MKDYLISVDLGGTKILSALIDKNNSIIHRDKRTTVISEGEEKIVKDIAYSIQDILTAQNLTSDDIKGISLGVPGTVNPHTGVIGNAPNLGVTNFNIKEALRQYFNIPIYIENDVNLGALGIKKFEYHNQVANMLVIFIGTGIGGALIFDGKLYRGSSFFAGEIGHMKVNPSGKLSSKSQSLTFEGLASRTAIVNNILSELKNNKKSELYSFHDSNKKIKSKDLSNALSKKDKLVIKHIHRAGKVTGTVLGSLVTLLNFDTIVLGGGVMEAMGSEILPVIEKSFYKAVLKEPGETIKFATTVLGDDAALYGGIALEEEFRVSQS